MTDKIRVVALGVMGANLARDGVFHTGWTHA